MRATRSPAGKNGGNRWDRFAGRRSIPCQATWFDMTFAARAQVVWNIVSASGRWRGIKGRLTHLEPVEEILTFSQKPWFRDVTGAAFAGEPSFHDQLTRGTPYWRARLDPACGIDLYGENGIAVADIDGDGLDEIYVCQPGGLPNRLYKNDGNGHFRDISNRRRPRHPRQYRKRALRRSAQFGPSGSRAGAHQPSPCCSSTTARAGSRSFRTPSVFDRAPQGTFTSVAAADYDRDGRLDLYFCCYFYFQSEAQYRYPVPYHDARNGPPNFLIPQPPGPGSAAISKT